MTQKACELARQPPFRHGHSFLRTHQHFKIAKSRGRCHKCTWPTQPSLRAWGQKGGEGKCRRFWHRLYTCDMWQEKVLFPWQIPMRPSPWKHLTPSLKLALVVNETPLSMRVKEIQKPCSSQCLNYLWKQRKGARLWVGLRCLPKYPGPHLMCLGGHC